MGSLYNTQIRESNCKNHLSDKRIIPKKKETFKTKKIKKKKKKKWVTQLKHRLEETFPSEAKHIATGLWRAADCHWSSGKCKSIPQWDVISHLLGWLLWKKPTAASVAKIWRNWKPHILLVGMQNSRATMENSMEVPQN